MLLRKVGDMPISDQYNTNTIQRVHVILPNISRYVAIAMQPMHWFANPPNSAQLGGTPYHTIPQSYIPVCAVGHAAAETHRHRRAWPQYILHHIRLTRNVGLISTIKYNDINFCLICQFCQPSAVFTARRNVRIRRNAQPAMLALQPLY